ncbi:MAG: hypothetical protein AAFR81_18225 [Chloroflexota bacterium]
MFSKRKRESTKHLRMVIGMLASTLLAIAMLLLSRAMPTHSDYDTDALATAQWLANAPQADPAFLQVHTDEHCASGDTHCFYILPDAIAPTIAREDITFTLRIDGHLTTDIHPELTDDNRLYTALPTDSLSAGLHLVEIDIRTANSNTYRHTWAINHHTGEVSAPPTLAVPPTYVTAVPDSP